MNPSPEPQLFADLGLDAWLVYDYATCNPVMAHLLGVELNFTRRAYLLLKPDEKPYFLVQSVDRGLLGRSKIDLEVETYTRWPEISERLSAQLQGVSTVAMEYSPDSAVPAMSRVDGGTLDLVRSLGVQVRSSAELFQLHAAGWSEDQLASHREAMNHAVAIKDLAFKEIRATLDAGDTCTEYQIQQFICAEFAKRSLVTDDPPVVAVNANSGDPHYEPDTEAYSSIAEGDWVLVDLWCKLDIDGSIFADITWVGRVGEPATEHQREVFDLVAGARDAVVDALKAAHEESRHLKGFELDDVARAVIQKGGYGDYFVHRTGHSLSPGAAVHGLGMNLDNLETHDTREALEGLGFTIEPGIYLSDFGIRSEINVWLGPDGPVVTAPQQQEPTII